MIGKTNFEVIFFILFTVNTEFSYLEALIILGFYHNGFQIMIIPE